MAQAAAWYLRAEEVGDVGSAPPPPTPVPAPAVAQQDPPSYHDWMAGLNPNGLPDDEVGGTMGS